METYFYLAIRLIVAAYVLYRLWRWLFYGSAMKMIWSRIPVRKSKTRPKAQPVAVQAPSDPDNVVGRTNIIYLEDTKAVNAQPVASDDLEQTGYLGQDEELSPDDVETDYRPQPSAPVPPYEELYGDEPEGQPHDPELSTGLSFEQIGEVISTLTAPDVDNEKLSTTAQTLFQLQGTDLFDFITSEVTDTERTQNLIRDYLTTDGEPLSLKSRQIEDFDINTYV